MRYVFKKTIKEQALDFSNAKIIKLPKLTTPDFNKDRRPLEYWEIFNKGLELYKKKLFEEAKCEFVKLLKHDKPHKTFYDYILRTYRKIIKQQLEANKIQNAYYVFEDFFIHCKNNITNTDRRRYNKLVEKLKKERPDLDCKTVEMEVTKVEPDFKILYSHKNKSMLLYCTKVTKENSISRKNWSYNQNNGSNNIYVKSIYNKEKEKYEKTLILIRDRIGKIINEFTLNQKTICYNSSKDSDKIIICSNKFKLFLYTINNCILSSNNIDDYVKNKSDIRFVDISPEGKYLLFSLIDKFYLMNSFKYNCNLENTINGWMDKI